MILHLIPITHKIKILAVFLLEKICLYRKKFIFLIINFTDKLYKLHKIINMQDYKYTRYANCIKQIQSFISYLLLSALNEMHAKFLQKKLKLNNEHLSAEF